MMRRGRGGVVGLPARCLDRGRQKEIEQARILQVAVFVIVHLLCHGDGERLGQPTMDLPFDDHWVDPEREAAIAAMKMAAERDDASEKNVAMENKVGPIRALLGELYLAAQMPNEALAEFEASQKTMPNRFRTIAGTATAARAVGSVEAAKRYYRALAGLAVNGDGDRPELAEAKTYLAQN